MSVVQVISCFGEVTSLMRGLQTVTDTALSLDKNAIVYVRCSHVINDNCNIQLKLVEETLTDGSKVYNIEMSAY